MDSSITHSFVTELSKYGLLTSFLEAQVMYELLQDVELPEELKVLSIQEFADKNGIKDSKMLNAYCESHCLTNEAIAELMIVSAKETYYLNHFINQSQVSHYFLSNLDEFTFVSFYMLPFRDRNICLSAYLRLVDRKITFDSLKNFSDYGDNPVKGCFYESLPLRDLRPPILRGYCDNNLVNKIIKPFCSDGVWYLFQLTGFTQPVLTSDVDYSIRKILFNQAIESSASEKLRSLAQLITNKNDQVVRRWMYRE
jgi:hypothetical protein